MRSALGQAAKSARKLTPCLGMPVHSLLVHVNMGGEWETGGIRQTARGAAAAARRGQSHKGGRPFCSACAPAPVCRGTACCC